MNRRRGARRRVGARRTPTAGRVRVRARSCWASRRRARRRRAPAARPRRPSGRPRRGNRRVRRSRSRRGRSQSTSRSTRAAPVRYSSRLSSSARAVARLTRSVMPTPWCASAWRGSRSRVTRPAASAAGQNRLPGRAKPVPASALYTLGFSPQTRSRMAGPTVSGNVRPRRRSVCTQSVSSASCSSRTTSNPAPTTTSVSSSGSQQVNWRPGSASSGIGPSG